MDGTALESVCGPWNETELEPCPSQGQSKPWNCVMCTPDGDLEGLHIEFEASMIAKVDGFTGALKGRAWCKKPCNDKQVDGASYRLPIQCMIMWCLAN